MPARPVRLDEISDKLLSAAAKSIAVPICCFKTCKAPGVVLLSLSYKDGHGEIYALCRRDLQLVLDNNPAMFVRESDQSMFVC